MTEAEYIDVVNLERVRLAREIMSGAIDIRDTVYAEDYQSIMENLYSIYEHLSSKVSDGIEDVK
jgi:hypothetical protein